MTEAAKEVKMYMHTSKAVRAGHPGDRVFLVVRSEGKLQLAWKCSIDRLGIKHPAFRVHLKPEALQKGFIDGEKNGTEPTAWIKKDSFYTEVLEADVEKIVEFLKASAPSKNSGKVPKASSITEATCSISTSVPHASSITVYLRALTGLTVVQRSKIKELTEAFVQDLKKV